jgi:Cu+-exporting ATPase
LHFNQSPQQKLAFIQLSNNIQSTLMIGDGLNDAGALKAASVGIAVSNDNNSFTPASDVVMQTKQLPKLKELLRLSKTSRQIITITFIISAGYNAVGLWYAVQGVLQPVIAAILMPLSSITIIAITYLATHNKAKKLQLKTHVNS